jgi:GDP-L-fucose synthase
MKTFIDKIVVTGGSGLLGKSLRDKNNNFIYLSSNDVDLTDNVHTKKILDSYSPSVIVHLAGKVGGIKDNIENPYDFILINNLLNTNVINYCAKNKVKLIFASSTCIYPKSSNNYPLTEEFVDSGEPEPTNNSYAYSKRFAGYMMRAAKKQYNLDYCTLYLCNLYGEHDNFKNDIKSHLVTSLIKKMHYAKLNKDKKITLLGTGSPLRQFMYAGDAANIIENIIDNNISGEYNVATNENLSVKDISSIIKDIISYEGIIEFNGLESFNGVYRKDVSTKKLIDIIGYYKFMSLKDGIEKTYKIVMENL